MSSIKRWPNCKLNKSQQINAYYQVRVKFLLVGANCPTGSYRIILCDISTPRLATRRAHTHTHSHTHTHTFVHRHNASTEVKSIILHNNSTYITTKATTSDYRENLSHTHIHRRIRTRTHTHSSTQVQLGTHTAHKQSVYISPMIIN